MHEEILMKFTVHVLIYVGQHLNDILTKSFRILLKHDKMSK